MYNVDFSPQFQNFAANGYLVIFVNPRGRQVMEPRSKRNCKHYQGRLR